MMRRPWGQSAPHVTARRYRLVNVNQLAKGKRQVTAQAQLPLPANAGAPTLNLIHTADWQLGMRRHVFSRETQGRFAQDRLDAIATLLTYADAENVDCVVVAGDVFDDNLVDRQTVLRTLDVLARGPKIPTFLLPANHDPLDPTSVYKTATFQQNCPSHVTVLTDMSEHVIKPNVVIVGAPWRTRRHAINPLEELASTLSDEGTLRVVVAHGGVDTLGGEHDTLNVLREADLTDLIMSRKAQYIALGDRHSTTKVGDTGRVYFSGAHEPTSPREIDPGNVLHVTVSRDSITVTVKKVGRWQFINEVVTFSSDSDIDQFLSWLGDPSRDRQRTVLRVGLNGVLSLAQHARVMNALDDAQEVYASVTRWQRHDTLSVAPNDSDLDQMNLNGFVADAFVSLRTDAAHDPVAAQALSLLYALAVKADT